MLPNTMNPMGLNRKPANDCLSDGTFDTTPRAIIRGGPCLIDGRELFKGKAEITTVTGNFKNLINANDMFSRNPNLSKFDARLDKVRDAGGLVVGDIALTEWHIPLPAATNANYAFTETSIKSAILDMPNVTMAHSAFYKVPLEDFQGNLDSLDWAPWMFCGTKLTSFDVNLPKMTKGLGLFLGARLEEWHIPLPALVNGETMFFGNLNLLSFDCALPLLTQGVMMFDNCTKLNATSITNIIASLPTYTSGIYNIGFENVLALTQAHIDAAAAKGWTVQGTPQA